MLTKWDKRLLITLICLTLASFFLTNWLVARQLNRGLAKKVVIEVDSREVLQIDLPVAGPDRQVAIKGKPGRAVLVVSGDRVKMMSSECPDQVCVRTGWISQPAQQIVCLPNRIVVKIVAERDEIDAVTY